MALKSIIYCLLRNSYRNPPIIRFWSSSFVVLFPQWTNELEMPRFYSDLYTPPKRSNTNVPSIILYNKFHRSFSLDAPRQSSINNSYFHRETFPTNCYSLASILAYIYIHYTQGFSHLTKSFHYVYRNVTDKLFDTFAINFLDNFEIPFRTITDVFPQKSIFFPSHCQTSCSLVPRADQKVPRLFLPISPATDLRSLERVIAKFMLSQILWNRSIQGPDLYKIVTRRRAL